MARTKPRDPADAVSALDRWLLTTNTRDADLAEKIGINRSQISRIRHSKCRPTVETAQKIEAITGISAASLVMQELTA